MNRRHFLTLAAVGAAAWSSAAPARPGKPAPAGPALLTVTGAIGSGNRAGVDPVRDQMLYKQNIRFDRAHAFDFAALAALPAVTIEPTLEYDGKPHRLSGPLLSQVLALAGAADAEDTPVVLRAVDGYAALLPLGELRKYRYIVATHLDGEPMALGGLGPLWAVYDADRFPDQAAKPLGQRFATCPWALYHIEVQVPRAQAR